MKCRKCDADMKDKDIKAELTGDSFSTEQIDLQVLCPKCWARYFTFIEITDLVEVDD